MKFLIRLIALVLVLSGEISMLGAAPLYPLKPGTTGRYLVDQQGTPFLIQADSAWDLVTALNNSEVTQYLTDRQAKGFNTLIVELVEHHYQGGGNPYLAPTNRYGQAPFLTAGNFSTPNEAYFTNADWVIDQAAARGMVVILFPCYVGYPSSGEGWYSEMLANGTNICRQYGAYVGNRYKNKPNIIWAMYGDHNPQAGTDGAAIQPGMDALTAGIQSADTSHIFTVHLQRNFDVRGLLSGDSGWLQLNSAYTDLLTYKGCLGAYPETPTMPFFLIENYYEGEHSTTAANIRAEAYWAVLSGSPGQTFGNNPTWGFFAGWQSALNSAGANDMTRVSALLLSRPWTNLVPDSTHITLTSGYGNYGDATYVAAARASDGAAMIAYLPAGGTVGVNMTKISGSTAKAWWYNPQTAAATAIGTFNTTGTQTFSAPNTNDWVLVVDDNSRNFSTPGTTISNALPIISAIPNQAIGTNTSAGPVPFSISDATTPASSLTLQVASSAPTLIPTNNIILGGSGGNRTVILTPMPGKSGNANITITVGDGTNTASTTFQLNVLVPPLPPTDLRVLPGGSGG